VTCALHLSRFDLGSGEALDPPAELPLVRYPLLAEDGMLVLELPAVGPIPVNE
jgi:nitrite reductase/ring-hydroxylating ferredoxin subunit